MPSIKLQHQQRSLLSPKVGPYFALCVLSWVLAPVNTLGAAVHRSTNFEVHAGSAEVASHFAQAAEEYRLDFAREWLETDPSQWPTLCRIEVNETDSGARGWVSVERHRGRIAQLRITLTGRLNRLLEYVLPHEIAHASLAMSFSQPFPRWADEGISLLAESENQVLRQRKSVSQLAEHDQLMPLREILELDDYPHDQARLVRFYLSTFSLTEYLIAYGGKQQFMEFVSDGSRDGWEPAVRRHYRMSLAGLEVAWRSKRTIPVTEQLANLGESLPIVPEE